VRAAPALADFTREQFLASLDVLTGLYAAAMGPPPQQLPGRRVIMERHARYTGFRAVVATAPGDSGSAAAPLPERSAAARLPERSAAGPPPDRAFAAGPPPERASVPPAGPGDHARATATAAGDPLIGFAYGFHGESGQWWHDLVRAALANHHGRRAARDWMSDSFEIAEIHVHPDHQGRGTGHALLLRLTQGRPERTAVLSTMDADTSARRLYRGVGFADLLPGFIFPGAPQPYTIMGATLPLAGSECPAAGGLE
jgi:GNAT superfamily N-acetyltransferase